MGVTDNCFKALNLQTIALNIYAKTRIKSM